MYQRVTTTVYDFTIIDISLTFSNFPVATMLIVILILRYADW